MTPIQKFLRAAGSLLCLGFLHISAMSAAATAAPEDPAARKVFRYAFLVAETGFDPAQISDTYSLTVTPHIFEALYSYDYLARPVKVKPLTAAAMPEVSAPAQLALLALVCEISLPLAPVRVKAMLMLTWLTLSLGVSLTLR